MEQLETNNRLRLHKFSPGIILGISCLHSTTSAIAADFQLGEFDLTLDSQVSIGTSIRTEERDTKLVSVGNGGSAPSNTTDDGNLNFDKGDAFSTIVKGTHELNASNGTIGAFVRAKWWHDATLANKKFNHGHAPNDNTPNAKLDDSNSNNYAKFSGIALLDAFVYGSFDILDKPLDLRLGRQVVSWGESTFIQGGINAINPVDASAFRRPGATLKEGLLPVNILYGNFGATDNVSIEGFYQLQWEPTVLDNCGTYFSTIDWGAEGCNQLAFASAAPDSQNFPAGAYIERRNDIEAKNSGQYGLASRFYSNSLDAEFGAYYANYHSRLPIANPYKNTSHAPVVAGGDGQYLLTYPEDIQLFGLSFSTTVKGWAVSGEVSYRPDLPVQINGNELLAASLAGAPSTALDLVNATPLNSVVRGHDTFAVTQLQTTFIKTFDRALGSSTIAFIGEVGATFVKDLPGLDEMRYGRNTTYGTGSFTPGDTGGYVTDSAWGYRLKTIATYPNAIGSVTLTPSLSWSHDVDGNSPAPGAQFIEDRQAISLGLGASYQDTYSANMSYTSYLDNADFDPTHDRDHVSLSLSMAF